MSFEVIPSEEISHRYDFAELANARGYKDAVEVGVDLGVFARDFLSRFRGHWLYLVDPYAPHADFPHDRSGDMLVAALALAPYHGRCRFVRDRSPECIPFVRSLISPEFVYVDGAHDEASVTADLEGWWDVLPPHGMLAGHDHDPAHPGVMAAVERFARERDLVVRLTHEPGFPSWYCYKTEPAILYERLWKGGERDNPRRGEGA